MLSDLREKTVLDIGCGMGQHAKQYADMGAKSVLRIDLSEKYPAMFGGTIHRPDFVFFRCGIRR